MSADFPSSNPFRRKDPSPTVVTKQNPPTAEQIPFQQEKPISQITHVEAPDALKMQTKPVKKVRVQSPPPSSPEADTWSPNPIARNDTAVLMHSDPFDGAMPNISDGDTSTTTRQTPTNPFQKTLETMEGGTASAPTTSVGNLGRAALDVDAFKRLLMTGNAGTGMDSSTASSTPTAPVVHLGLGDGGSSSTDTSSLSRQSIFEPIQEPHSESPRTSHEISEPEDERRRATTDYQGVSTSSKKKPPPPSSRHGKLIKVELRDEPSSTGMSSPPTPNSGMSQQYFNTSTTSPPSSIRSQTDLNKPLPPAPAQASHESDRESIFDKEAAGKTPEPPSPSASLRRKTPPVPPLARRHSQFVSDSKLARNESGRLSPRVEEDNTSIADITAGRSRSNSARAPPPPPSRRPGSIKSSSNQAPLSPQSSSSGPPVPPTRMPSTRHRPMSVSSMDMSTPKRASVIPPPPPPHRHGRSSMDTQRPMISPDPRTSGDLSHYSIDSGRRDSAASSASQADRPGTSSGDILADLSALQREIDALKAKSEKEAAN